MKREGGGEFLCRPWENLPFNKNKLKEDFLMNVVQAVAFCYRSTINITNERAISSSNGGICLFIYCDGVEYNDWDTCTPMINPMPYVIF